MWTLITSASIYSLYALPIITLSALGIYVRLLPLYKRAIKRVANHVGFRSLISPFSGAGFGTPRIRGIYQGFDMPWREKHKVFEKWGSDVITSVSWTGRSVIYLADADLIQKINGNARFFPKPVEEYTVLNFFGPNLVTAAGKAWRRQFNVSKDVFNSAGMGFLWTETRNIFDSMMTTNGWNNLRAGEEIVTPHVVDITLRIALLAIANAGFGMHMTWNDDPNAVTASGHEISFQSALHTVAQNSILKMSLPWFCYWLPIPHLWKVRTAFKELEVYIKEMIDDRKAAILGASERADEDDRSVEEQERYDLFHNLVKASMTGEEPLSDAELMGNIYIYLLAGHETTAHSIAFTFGLLAMNPKAQEKLYQHVMEFMPEDGVTDYEAFYPLFDYVRAVYFETLRMFPPVQQIPKIVAYDTVLILPETNAHNVELGLAREAQTQKLEGPSPITPPSTPTRLSSSESNSSVASTRSSASSSSSSSSSSTDSNLDSGSPLDMSPSSSTTSLSSVEEDEKDVCAATFAESVVPLTTIGDSSVVEAQALSLPLVPAADEIRLASGATWTRSTTTTSVNDRIPTPTVLPGQKSLLVEKDTIIFVDPPAVHYNPKYYPEPYEFRPERFIGAYDEKAFIPFSSGTRVCLGRRFSEVESVVVIAYMIREFSIHPIPLRNEKTGDVIKETRDEMMARMFRATPKITLTPHEMPIMFRKRKDGSGVVPEDAFP